MPSEARISYDLDERRALISYSGDPKAWPALRRRLQDETDQVELEGTSSLRVPWWALLTAWDSLTALAERHRVALIPEGAAAAKLKRAGEVRERYARAVEAQPIGAAAVKAMVRESGFTRKLTDEQARNVGRLLNWDSGATFSVPGAGKTTEALAVYSLRRTPESRLVVVCPKNAFAAWEEQLALCLPHDAPFVRLRGGRSAIEKTLESKKPSKCLLTYQQLPNVASAIANYLRGNSSFLFLDESHKIKRGLTGVIGSNILSIAEIPDVKIIMSGTPMPNSIEDLVPQFRFLYPEIAADESNVEQYIKPVYVRTTKVELDLPKVKHTIKKIPLRPAQFELYQLMRSELARQMKIASVNDRMRLRRAGQSALRLLQVVSNPALLARLEFDHPAILSDVLEEGDSPKLEYACFRARQLAHAGSKSIIWSSFVSNVELVARRLLDLGAEFIHGGVDAGSEDEEGTREQKIKRFHEDPSCWTLVANPAACGEGISLHTVCHHAIYLDRNYNAAQFLQSQDRIHRLGLRKKQITYVEILSSPETVDESVNRRLNEKIANMARVLSDPSLMVEPEEVDLDDLAFTAADLHDFEAHLRVA
jgi:SNF2 family DNA or RNA helicase